LLHPSSERETVCWAKNVSALGELLEVDFSYLSENSLYRASDMLVKHRDEIESRLAGRAKSLFDLGEKIILYDLTNTYLEGDAEGNEKAKRGRSKEKRSDCPLLTLALVVDEEGFPKASKVFPGNVSEPGTLREILRGLKKRESRQILLFTEKPTIVIDAGIATEENLAIILGEEYHYVCIGRTRPAEVPAEGLLKFETSSGGTVCLKETEKDGEVFLFCQSEGRKKKEEGMKSRFVQGFEEGLKAIAFSLQKPRGHKEFNGIIERLGRLKERYPVVAGFYQVEVKRLGDKAVSLKWELKKEHKLEARFAGSYYIRTDRKDLSPQELWQLYMERLN
jgi:transposase